MFLYREMVFPELTGKKGGYLNLGALAKQYERAHPSGARSAFLDPAFCEAYVLDMHRQYGIAYSYGGYLEDRRALWRGSYLEERNTFLHLGVDCNAPVGTAVALDRAATLVLDGSDFPEEHGWGRFAVFSLARSLTHTSLLYAHLDDALHVRRGSILPAGTIIGTVGSAPRNGNWYPHVHVQALTGTAFELLRLRGISAMDGYGAAASIAALRHLYPNPAAYLDY